VGAQGTILPFRCRQVGDREGVRQANEEGREDREGGQQRRDNEYRQIEKQADG
jgi:hypothetical protein